MSTHLFRLKTEEQKHSLNLQTGLLKFCDANLIAYFLAAGLASFLTVTVFIMCLDSFSFASLKQGVYTFLCFFNLNEKAKYIFRSFVFLYLSHEMLFEFFEVLTFNSIQTNNVIADTSELIQVRFAIGQKLKRKTGFGSFCISILFPIQNLDDIWSTRRVLCWMRGEIESFLVRFTVCQSEAQTKERPADYFRSLICFPSSRTVRKIR